MDNSKNLFSIGEIARSIGITRKIILNYETKGLIKPDVTTQTKSPEELLPGG
ncbi:MAG: MerR family transcriptional regulator [Monoglobaceae bacterium]